MKRSAFLGLVVFLILGSFFVMALDANAAAKTSKSAKATTVTGTVEQTGDQFTLTSGKKSYTITGQDFSSYVGKKVKATGKLTKSDTETVFEVTNIKEVPTKAAPTPAKRAK